MAFRVESESPMGLFAMKAINPTVAEHQLGIGPESG
jgi:hypothetical protein